MWSSGSRARCVSCSGVSTITSCAPTPRAAEDPGGGLLLGALAESAAVPIRGLLVEPADEVGRPRRPLRGDDHPTPRNGIFAQFGQLSDTPNPTSGLSAASFRAATVSRRPGPLPFYPPPLDTRPRTAAPTGPRKNPPASRPVASAAR